MPAFDRSDFTPFRRYLDTNGDGTGTKSAIGDYSGAPEEFFIQPPTDDVFALSMLLPSIGDAGKFGSSDYGAMSMLTNGILVQKTDSVGNVLEDLTDQVPIRCNGHWLANAGHATRDEDPAAADNWATVSWSLGGRLPLVLRHEERFVVKLNDNFSGLTAHWFKIEGVIANYLHGV